jgi:sugar lactone lactonase YvrE
MRAGLGQIVPIALALALPACGNDHTEGTTQQVLESGDIGTWAGNGTQGHDGDGHPRLQSWLNQPMALLFADEGSALILDWNNHAVRRVTSQGTLETVIGQPFPGDWPCQVPDEPANCTVPLGGAVPGVELNLNHPTAAAWDGTDGSFYLAAWHNHKVEHYDAASGAVTIVAGGQKPGFIGDGGPAQSALLNFPSSVAVQADGGLLVADERNNRVRRIAPDSSHTITTVAGAAAATGTDSDGVPATTALLKLTTTEEVSGADNPPPGGGIALDSNGALFIADTFHDCVRRVDPGSDGIVGSGDPKEETVSTAAGTCGKTGYAGDGGAATAAQLNRPFGLALSPDGALYIADTKNHAVRRVEPMAGTIETVAGNGSPGFSGDGGLATAAHLREPYGVAFDPSGNLYVVDTLNNRIRQVVR